jgi:hypothetical protein
LHPGKYDLWGRKSENRFLAVLSWRFSVVVQLNRSASIDNGI